MITVTLFTFWPPDGSVVSTRDYEVLVLDLPPLARLVRVLVHTGDRLNLPPSLFKEGLETRMCMASFTPLLNHLGSTASIFACSMSTWWSGWSMFTCFETSEFTLLGLRCSMNLALRDLSVSPIYDASQSRHGIWVCYLFHPKCVWKELWLVEEWCESFTPHLLPYVY